jgi:hypothetical protein
MDIVERLRKGTYYGLEPYEAADEITKLRAELGSLKDERDMFKSAYNEWARKTDWMQERPYPLAQWLGKHRADVLVDSFRELAEATKAMEFNFAQYQDVSRMLCEVQDVIERTYKMLLSEPDTKGALFKAENILREALADMKEQP